MSSVVLWKLCALVVLIGVYGVCVDEVPVSVMEGDPVTLYTNLTTNQHDKIKWYSNDTRIAEISVDMRCTDVQCKDGDERFRDRLKLDHQTGSLTITDTRTTDSGLYQLEVINSGNYSEKTFSITVHGVSAAEQDKMKGTSVKEGESDSGVSSAAVAGICVGVGVVLLFAAAAAVCVIYYHKHHQAGQYKTGTRTQHNNQVNGVAYTSINPDDNGSEPAANEPSQNGNVNTSETLG